MTAYEFVLEMISNAYENGYEAEIKDLEDEYLAQDLLFTSYETSSFTYEDILAAVKEFRNV